MSCLVNPHGWRLYFSKYWKSNFFIKKKLYFFFFLKTKLIFEVVSSILNQFQIKNFDSIILSFSFFKILLNYKTIYILINYKFYWKNFFYEIEAPFLRSNYLNLKKIMPLKNFSKKNVILKYFLEKKIFFHDSHFFLRSNKIVDSIFFKKIIYFFYLLPHLIFLKSFLNMTLQKVTLSTTDSKIFFFGANQKTFNIKDILDFAESLLRKRFSTVFVFYKLIRILSVYKMLQKLSGFKVLLTGRFTRRDRATFVWKTFGSIGLSSRVSAVEFYVRPLVLVYSKCAIKIWLCQN